MSEFWKPSEQMELYHHGVKGMKWGVRKNVTNRRKPGMLIKQVRNYIRRVNKIGNLMPGYAERRYVQAYIQAGQVHLQNHQEFMRMSVQNAQDHMNLSIQNHANTMHMHNQATMLDMSIHNQAHMNAMSIHNQAHMSMHW